MAGWPEATDRGLAPISTRMRPIRSDDISWVDRPGLSGRSCGRVASKKGASLEKVKWVSGSAFFLEDPC